MMLLYLVVLKQPLLPIRAFPLNQVDLLSSRLRPVNGRDPLASLQSASRLPQLGIIL